jgi:hypothetical protein
MLDEKRRYEVELRRFPHAPGLNLGASVARLREAF